MIEGKVREVQAQMEAMKVDRNNKFEMLLAKVHQLMKPHQDNRLMMVLNPFLLPQSWNFQSVMALTLMNGLENVGSILNYARFKKIKWWT